MSQTRLGEFELIDQISKTFDHVGGDIGIGDDCSVVSINESSYQITTTDLLIENVHFLKDKISSKNLGRKSFVVSFSDIAAMGGIPKSAYLSIGLPKTLEQNYIDGFFEGIKEVCQEYKVKLLGGDTTKSPTDIVINVLVQGEVAKENCKLRSAARPGDVICVTGYLGDSAIGLESILENTDDSTLQVFKDRHNKPRAHVEEGKWLSTVQGVHAMMDVSDGVASDIKHICKLSNVGAKIELESFPLSKEAKEYLSTSENKKIWKHAFATGEDYVLLLTLSSDQFETISLNFEKQFARPLLKIGTITKDSGVQFIDAKGNQIDSLQGFDHFRENK